MILPDFELASPPTLEEALALLARHGPAATVMAGGTDLLVTLKEGAPAPAVVVSLTRIPELARIHEGADALIVGAAATANAVAASEIVRRRAPALADAARTLASYPVRNRATIGGNLAGAVPSADFPPILIALEASVDLISPRGPRRVALADFFVGARRTVRAPDEILTAVRVPVSRLRTGACYLKFGRRGASALAVAGVAARVQLDGDRCAGCRVVLGAVAPTPLLVRPAGDCPFDRRFNPECMPHNATAAIDQSRPITDVRGSVEYRRHLVERLTRRAVEEAARRA